MTCYDREGKPIEYLEWARLLQDESYQRVAETTLERAGRKLWISTVWLGLNHNFRGEVPLIFETMIFWEGLAEPGVAAVGLGLDLFQERYATEADAKTGHERAVAKAREVLEAIDRAT